MNNNQKKKIVRMDDQTWRIIDGYGKGTIYSYLLCGNEKAILIDTGMGFTDLKRITDKLTPLPVEVVNTHGHLDHIARNYQYETVYLHPADEAIFKEHSSDNFRLMLLQRLLAEFKFPGWMLKLPIIHGKVKKFCELPVNENRHPLADGMKFELGGRTIEVVCTPGHTLGSVCLLDIERRQLFTGDTVCDEGILLMFDHSSSVQIFKESVLRLKAESTKFVDIWPAHHFLPLNHNWLDEYIKCADQILAGTAAAESVSNPLGDALVAKYGRISIAYRPDRIR